ncbi:homoprotocatechuate degradation operon regulator HpaR [Herbaspirillum sp. RTI4]|uniref:homoprotocatechuate degradation operon regulator HpaR n=1 Tax=Herbaspirillum sp. RTI4 TaxID=3048640 RepID=UPI002AB596E6|nr:homoprotocatechuate degradation operon regulator HpaR [Herbaspirillum sp. RTI4]MDY7577667.1 homoprotocatechuate degradation operon regulator HpaR [Herbaspirillum sp. RTI4]MEA9982167.1 homoprotocatechuate degradation operon regulator HpaR [Herbaspirillum sp. RTI4]
MKHRIAYRNLPQLFLQSREHLMSHFRPILNHFGVTEQQWRVLRLLDEHGQLEPRELCDLCQILSSSMSGVLLRMEDMDLVCREAVADDRRRLMVRLAPGGDRIIGEIAPLIELQYRHIEQAFGKRIIGDLLSAFEGFMSVESAAVEQVDLRAYAASSGVEPLKTKKNAGKASGSGVKKDKKQIASD